MPQSSANFCALAVGLGVGAEAFGVDEGAEDDVLDGPAPGSAVFDCRHPDSPNATPTAVPARIRRTPSLAAVVFIVLLPYAGGKL